MTKITFYQRVDGTFQGFHSQDHAGYSAEGQDIVCAAVSALVINFVNSLDELTENSLKLVDGSSDLADGTSDLKDGVDDLVDGVSDLSDGASDLYDGLTSVEEEHGQYLDVIFKEV